MNILGIQIGSKALHFPLWSLSHAFFLLENTTAKVFLLQFINDSIQLMDGNSEFPFQSNLEIPFDLFVGKKSEGLGTTGSLRFTDSKGHLVYTVQHPIDNSTNCNSTHCTKLLLDASGDTLFSVNRVNVSILWYFLQELD